jgi:hypothetical protein
LASIGERGRTLRPVHRDACHHRLCKPAQVVVEKPVGIEGRFLGVAAAGLVRRGDAGVDPGQTEPAESISAMESRSE